MPFDFLFGSIDAFKDHWVTICSHLIDRVIYMTPRSNYDVVVVAERNLVREITKST